jgi:thiaminase/transcriptional activator TenA
VLIDDLRAAAQDEWTAFTRHPFVLAVQDGTLAPAAFRAYLVQDYRFLVHFARAHALAVLKADTLADMRAAARGISAILDQEMDLHVRYCAGWGISAEELEATPEHPANVAYTRFVLDAGLAGDALDLAVALAPCTVGYGDIGRALAADPATTRGAANPYEDWIATYSGDAYLSGVDEAIAQLDRLFERRGGPARMASLIALFRRATVLESAFWQIGLDGQSSSSTSS